MAKVSEPNVTKSKRRKGQVVGYLRVITLDQKELRQLEGIRLDKQFADKAWGKDLRRPQLEQLTSTFARVTPSSVTPWIGWPATWTTCGSLC